MVPETLEKGLDFGGLAADNGDVAAPFGVQCPGGKQLIARQDVAVLYLLPR